MLIEQIVRISDKKVAININIINIKYVYVNTPNKTYICPVPN